MPLRPLKARERRDVAAELRRQFGGAPELEALLENREGKLFAASVDVGRVDLSRLRVEAVGLAVGRRQTDGLRLSIEGSQLVGPHASHHVLKLDDQQLAAWLRGESVPAPGEDGYFLLRAGQDFVGCAKRKGGLLLNAVPKARRLRERI